MEKHVNNQSGATGIEAGYGRLLTGCAAFLSDSLLERWREGIQHLVLFRS